MSTDRANADKLRKRYQWMAFVTAGMIAGFVGCLVYSYMNKGRHHLLSTADAGNPGTIDKAVIQTALTVDETVSSSAFLGVEITSVDAVIAEQLSLPSDCGVLVNSVVDESPAQKAGLQRGDCLLSLNNITVKDVDGFREIMAELNPGDNARIIYVRDGQKDTVYTTLANSSAVTTRASGADSSDWGVSLAVLSSDLQKSLRIGANVEGIVLLSVTPGGLADEAGLQAGDVITGIDNRTITNMSDFFAAIAASDDNIALLDIYSKGQLRYVALDSTGVAETIAQRQTSLLDKILSVFTDDNKVILVEHTNEEDDYEKPVCKRLEESGERYEDQD